MYLSCIFTFVDYTISEHARACDATTKIPPGVISRRDVYVGHPMLLTGDAKLRSRRVRSGITSTPPPPENDAARLCFRVSLTTV